MLYFMVWRPLNQIASTHIQLWQYKKPINIVRNKNNFRSSVRFRKLLKTADMTIIPKTTILNARIRLTVCNVKRNDKQMAETSHYYWIINTLEERHNSLKMKMTLQGGEFILICSIVTFFIVYYYNSCIRLMIYNVKRYDRQMV